MKSRMRVSQRGSSLIMLIGIIAALAIMASTLVVVIVNMQGNTADSRVRNKAQGVAEAAMDAQMYALAKNWPETDTSSPAPTLDSATVRTQFDTTEFPDGPGEKFASAIYYENSDTNGDGKVTSADAPYDANNDSILVVEAQGNVADRAARVTGMVQRTFVSTWFPQGVVLYDGGNLNVQPPNGQISIHEIGTAPIPVVGQVAGTYESGAFGDGVAGVTAGSFDQVVPVTTLQQVITMAKGFTPSRYFDLRNGGTLPTDWSGVCVINANDGLTIPLPQNAGINMSSAQGAEPLATDEPGILFIIGNPIITYQGHTNFYGIFYTDGQLGVAPSGGAPVSGTPNFYGMTICGDYVDVNGSAANISYDDSAILKLRNKYTLTVVLVPNTWREIRPQ